MEKKTTFIFNLTIAILSLNYHRVRTFDLSTDQHALEAFKSQITIDPFNILSKNWSAATPVCTWIGVFCSDQRVVQLDLSNKGLFGKISPHIGNLSFLNLLDLTNNTFHGPIPPEISQLRRLEKAYMGLNNLTGNLPFSYFNTMPKLEHLFLNNNNLTGTLPPPFLDNMTTLKSLDFRYNALYGNIPKEIGNRSRVEDLLLGYNQLSGSVPSMFFNTSSLVKIDLSFNGLSGSLPESMCDELSNLMLFYMLGNEFTGPIPSRIYKCRQLRYINFSRNKFNSSIPRGMGNLTLVKELFLGENDLQGLVPVEIGNLKSLEILSIRKANLVGHIPPVIFNISTLKVIDFSNNSLSGVLSSNIYANLHYLEELYLHNNEFTGEVPSDFWKFNGIRKLILSSNKFTGTIPPKVGNLTRLTHLYLGRNNFIGLIPHEIGYLNQLEDLSLPENSFTGNIPFNISTLKKLDLNQNLFSGELPAAMGFLLPNLEELYLSSNNFQGNLPSSISNASKLSLIELSMNSFSGSIPLTIGKLELLERLMLGINYFTAKGLELDFLSSLTNCRKLRTLAFAHNPLKGSLPASVGNLSTLLQTFQAFECGIKGKIPSGIGNLTNLRSLSLDTNELEGFIPSTLGKLQNLGHLYLENNRLSGGILRELCLLGNLEELYLSDNRLSGIIPSCLGNIDSLMWLSLESNRLTSPIPSNLWNLGSLVLLNLSSNLLTGKLSSSNGSFRALLTALDLSFNRLSGDIPSSIGGYQMMNKLSLAHNMLRGSIPESLGTLISLEHLDLSHNNLSGVIPRSLESLRHLEYLNLSFNRLHGEIPNGGPFGNFTAPSFAHNSELCGAPRLKVSSCTSRHRVSFLKYIIPFVVFTMGLVTVLYFLRRQRKSMPKNPESSTFEWKRVLYYELVRAPEAFDDSNLIGKGGYGSVFKGRLADGVSVAVKVFNLLSENAIKSFDVECEVLRNIRHRNLVRIISSCTNDDFRCLVMEYMPNGSLEQWLYSHNNHLNFLQRLQIMIDVALALEYLHHGQTTPIIHCDLKPDNVLLDEDMNARVCDFGIAKIVGDADFIVRTKTLGTIGYMAPEYGMEGIISTGVDVYSFGILILETFTRKKPTEDMFCGDISLRSWVREAARTSVFDVVDEHLIDEQLSSKEESLASIFNLAMDCTFGSSSRRINMDEVVVRLGKIQKSFSASN